MNYFSHQVDALFRKLLNILNNFRLPTRTVFKSVNRSGFTIVELLVVIVVIGILASITIVSYSGITNRANISNIQAELVNSSKKLAMYYVQNGVYPTTLDSNGCPSAPVIDTNNCIKVNSGSTYDYIFKTATSYDLYVTRAKLTYKISENTTPVASINPNWLTIGSQTWAKANLDVGVMIAGETAQTNNAILEKYCYNNQSSNCTTYGALYMWSEAMRYITAEGAQGICPAGSHIPSDNEWKILELQLGMTQGQADDVVWRGTNQGTQLKSGGASGLNIPLAGNVSPGGFFSFIGSEAYLWSSSQAGDDYASMRSLSSSNTAVYRNDFFKPNGFSVRCIKN